MVQLIRAILFDPELELRPEQIAKIAVIVPRQSKPGCTEEMPECVGI